MTRPRPCPLPRPLRTRPGLRAPRGALALLASLALCPAPAGAELRAEQIRADTAPELLLGGPDAIGGIGDWYLANELVEAIVDDPARAHGLVNHGGTLVDAGLRDRRGEDQLVRIFPLLNLSQQWSLGYDAIRAERGPGSARLVVESTGGPRYTPQGQSFWDFLNPLAAEPDTLRDVHVETVYAVRPGEPVVHLTTTFHNRGERPAPLFAYADMLMRGAGGMRVFYANTLEPERSPGYHHLGLASRNPVQALDGMVPVTFLAMPGLRPFPPIAYGLFSPERHARGQRFFAVTHDHVSVMNVFPADDGWTGLGLWRLWRATRFRLGPGERFVLERRLLVAGRSDAAAVTDHVYPALGAGGDGRSGISGRVGALPASVQVDRADGTPVTQRLLRREGEAGAGAEAPGRFRLSLPPGEYVLTVRAPQRPAQRRVARVAPGETVELPPVAFPEPARLSIPRAFADGGPGRIVFRGLDGTPDPVFAPELLDFRIDGEKIRSATEIGELHAVGNGSDPRELRLPPGRYRLTAVRDFEHAVASRVIDLPEPGARRALEPFDLPRVAAVPGFVTADFHVHAQASHDTNAPNEAQLRSFVAGGIDVLVSTDHQNVGDLEPALARLGVGDRIRVVRGVEITGSAPNPQAPYTLGHHNVWPIAHRPLEHRRGAPSSQNRSVADVYAELRRDHGGPVVQLNHPRPTRPGVLDGEDFFSHLGRAGRGFDPSRPLDAEPNRELLRVGLDGETRALDFHALERMNGKSADRERAVRADWHALLRQGIRRTATANSDTHTPARAAGFPRNYVAVDPLGFAGADREARFRAALDAAVRDGRLFGSNGPLLLRFEVAGAGMGALVRPAGAAAPDGGPRPTAVPVRLAVAAAPWVPVDEVRLLVNGEVVERFPVAHDGAGAAPLHLERAFEVTLARDAFLTLEAGAPLDAEPAAWAAAHPGPYSEVLAPGFLPNAFSNPVFVDVDGNGRFDPPGLPGS